MISQGIIREARLFAHSSVLMQVKGEETRREACLLWHIAFPPFSQHCLLSHRELMFICSRSRLRCEMICFRFLHQRFYRQIIQVFVGKRMNSFSLSVRPLSLKREKKGIFRISCHRCWWILQKIFSAFPSVCKNKQKKKSVDA